jgi:serine protease AprX
MALLALNQPLTAAAAPASKNPGRLDDEVVRQLQSTPESQRIPVIVEGAPDSSDSPSGAANERRARRAEDKVRGKGGEVSSSSNLIGATVAQLTPAQIRALSEDSSVGRIHFDAPVRATSIGNKSSAAADTPITYPQTIGAPDAWKAGNKGKGVTVAVLDSGIENSSAFGARVKARVDLIDPSHPAQGDPAGHGTHVAGIIAASHTSPVPGIAPEANLVSVRVLNEHGQSRLSTVIHGLEWTITHRKQLGIDVIVMALGAQAQGSYREDPLAAAVELAWRSGVVVVTASGNDGPDRGTIQTPGFDPLVLTVGALDENGTATRHDDTVPSWSSQGPTADGFAKPDLVAPGRKIVSLRVPGGTLDKETPDHIEGPRTFRLSGSSQATAVAAGAVALLLDQRPGLDPDQVKALLVDSARPVAGVAKSAQGAGSLDVARAQSARTPKVAPSKIAPSYGLIRALLPQLRHIVKFDGEVWDKVIWDKVIWDKVIWDKVIWDKVIWDKVIWDKVIWDKVIWDKVIWDGVTWDKVIWD